MPWIGGDWVLQLIVGGGGFYSEDHEQRFDGQFEQDVKPYWRAGMKRLGGSARTFGGN